MYDNFDNKSVLITGGTGSFGRNFIKHLLNNSNAKKIIVFSRDELKQSQMLKEIKDERLRFFIGDVRDLGRLNRAFNKVDIVVHAAALKQVDTLEYNPFEAVKTNILGTQNVIDASIDQGVQKVILISTDKAVEPINLYGSTKMCAEKLFISGNSYTQGQTKFSCVRYGNVIGSRGSIVETLIQKNAGDTVKITDERMTRFWISLDQSFSLVLFALKNMRGGEIFIPKIPSMKLVDLIDAIAPNCEREVIGIRPGEKLHESLLIKEEVAHAVEFDNYIVVIPEFSFSGADYDQYFKNGRKLDPSFSYTSDNCPDKILKEDIINIVKKISL